MKRIIKAGLMLLLGAAIWTNGGVEKADAQTGGYWEQAQQQQQQQQRQQEQINQQNQMMYSPQYACVNGRDIYGYIGDAACGGGNQQNNNNNSQPVVMKPSSYGAFVHNKKTNSIGESSRKSTSNEALRSAYIKANCKTEKDCAVVSTYQNQCVALAWGKSFFESRGGNTETAAKKSALSACGKASKNCQVVMTSCSPAGEIDNAQQYKGLGE